MTMVVTGASDHHGAGKIGHDLGCETTAPHELQRIVDLATSLGSPTTIVGRRREGSLS